MHLENVAAIVTGASTGIGRAIADMLGSNRARVALVGRDTEALTRTQEMVGDRGGQATLFVVDLSHSEEIALFAQQFQETFGTADIIVNAAAVWHDSDHVLARPIVELPLEQLDKVLAVGVRAPMLLAKLLLPGMIERRRGKILNISGTFTSGAGWLDYYVSKKALEHFTIGLADEVSKYNIQVNCISPADVATEALKRFFPDDASHALDPAEVAHMAGLLLADKVADHLTGQIVVVRRHQLE